MPHFDGAAGQTVAQQTRDSELQQQLHSELGEAAERVTFHRCELERWQRIGRAAQRALRELDSVYPVPQQAPDGFLDDEADVPMKQVSF